MSPEAGSALIALAGAIIGSTVVLFGQRQASSQEARRLEHQTRGRVNALAVAVFRDFLACAKIVERLAERREAGEILSDDVIRTATDAMWLKLQEVEVFCPTEIGIPAREFVDAHQLAVWDQPHVPVDTFLAGPRKTLFSVARPFFQESD